MLLHISSFQPSTGKAREAVNWAREAAMAMNEGLALARPCEVLSELFGQHGRIYMVAGYQDWAQLEQVRTWARADHAYLGLLARSVEAELFVPAARRDTLLETV